MTANGHRPARTSGRLSNARTSLRHAIEATRRAFAEFLTIPTIVIGGFLLLALATYFLDQAHNTPRLAISAPASGGLFSDPEAARGFLGVVAASIITVTSITFSLLLIAVQQGAAALTNLVFDQFLRRRANQLFFGFFIGLGLYSLAMLATINPSHQPIYGVLFAGLMTVLALYMLVLLIYTTIDQMRPVVIIEAIHNRTLLARECQLHFLRHSRRSSQVEGGVAIPVTADQNGFLAQLNIAAIEKAVAQIGCEAEVVVLISFGDYVAFGDPIAEIRADFATDISPLVPVVKAAIFVGGTAGPRHRSRVWHRAIADHRLDLDLDRQIQPSPRLVGMLEPSRPAGALAGDGRSLWHRPRYCRRADDTGGLRRCCS